MGCLGVMDGVGGRVRDLKKPPSISSHHASLRFLLPALFCFHLDMFYCFRFAASYWSRRSCCQAQL